MVSGSILAGVSCTSATFCMAVGQTLDGNMTVVEEWDGASAVTGNVEGARPPL